MRSPYCVHCGEYITHFGKGYKWSLIKVKGYYCHESCYEKYKSSKPIRKHRDKRYYLKNKEKIKARNKIYSKIYYHKNRERLLKMHKTYPQETDDVYRVKIL